MSELTYTILDSAPESLHKTGLLVTGATEALLVDAAFTRADGHRLVAAVLDSGATLTTVVVTAPDPDFYFGAEVVADAFPQARFVAPADVIGHIKESYAGKLEAWAHLGANLPTRLVDIEEIAAPAVEVDGTTVELRQGSETLGDRSYYLYEPESRAVFGGVLLFGDLHVWTADTGTVESRAEWIRVLDELEALDPTYVVAGHRAAGSATDLTPIRHTRAYLQRFEEIVAEAADGAAVEQALLAGYPQAGLAIAAHLGALVAKGELAWG